MATSDSPLNVPNVTLAVARGTGLRLVAETGFNITGQVADLAEVTISGQDFGMKAPQRHFDRVDRHWNNGTEVVNPYGALTDGASLPNTYTEPSAPFPDNGFGTDMYNWKMRAEAARPGRSIGYQLESDNTGKIEGFSNAGFAGWPASQRDSEHIYVRHWRFMLYPPTNLELEVFDGQGAVPVLSSDLPAGATQLELAAAPLYDRFGEGFNHEFYVRLQDGSLQLCTQIAPFVSPTVANFEPPLSSPALAGARVHVRENYAHKELRIRDENPNDPGNPSNYNCYAFSGFCSSTSKYAWGVVPGYYGASPGDVYGNSNKKAVKWVQGVWELWEHYTIAPKNDSDHPQGMKLFTRINGRISLDITNPALSDYEIGGSLGNPPLVGWPSSGCAVTNYGYEQDRPHTIPGNKFRLSDIYVDNSRRRVEIGIGSDDLYSCMPRECCPIKTWSNSITVNLNALPFTEAELAQARVFVVDEDDTATLVGRIQ